MESGRSRHLTESDLEKLAQAAGRGEGPEWKALREHFRGCVECQRRMQQQAAQTAAQRIDMQGVEQWRTQTQEACPPVEQWALLAGGLLGDRESDSLLDHAASCHQCGRLLRTAVEELESHELPPEAISAASLEFGIKIAGMLKAANGKPKTVEMPRKIQDSGGPRRTPKAPWIWGAAAAAAAILIMAGVRQSGWLEKRNAEQLLAKAYQADRTWSARLTGAEFTPRVASTRASAPASLPLAEAEATILRELQSNPEDAYWRRMRGRLDFVRRRYDSAIASLKPLADKPDAAPAVWIELATVQVARGVAEGTAEAGAAGAAADFESAVEYLSRALRQDPNQPVALFNRALALEGLSLWNQAAQDWKKYLEIDSSSGWAEEAREHLRLAEKKTPGFGN